MRGERVSQIRKCCVAIVLLVANASVGGGATMFYDDFSDGNAEDGTPVSWSRSSDFRTGDLHVSNGLTLESNGALGVIAADLVLSDTSVRTQVRLSGDGEVIGGNMALISARETDVTNGYYLAGIAPPYLAFISREPGEEPTIAINSVSFNTLDDDVVLQFDVMGGNLSLWVWPAGEPMPDRPTVTVTDGLHEVGSIGLVVAKDNPSAQPASGQFRYVHVADTPIRDLQPGDADQDSDFDQLDLVQIQQAGKYMTGQLATWGEGDWNGAPSGSPGYPPLGDGVFNQLDVVAAQQAAKYMTGSYAAHAPVAVPEPGSLLLLAIGLVAFGVRYKWSSGRRQ